MCRYLYIKILYSTSWNRPAAGRPLPASSCGGLARFARVSNTLLSIWYLLIIWRTPCLMKASEQQTNITGSLLLYYINYKRVWSQPQLQNILPLYCIGVFIINMFLQIIINDYKISWKTIFFIFFSLSLLKMRMFLLSLTLERETYTCPWEKNSVPR